MKGKKIKREKNGHMKRKKRAKSFGLVLISKHKIRRSILLNDQII